ncbi:MAG: NYN domain-containing protein, partial [Clostridia bacterium]|nr:NYN domain-containing protein [Clostridia bacterium]
LRVRDSVTVGGTEEKISALYRVDGAKRTPVDRVTAGGVCAAAGLSAAAGDGLGYERQGAKAVLEPVMSYRVVLPQGCDAEEFLPKLRQLEEEDPLLRVTWDADLREIGVALMGKVQAEILTALVRERYDIDVTTDRGRVLLKETVAAPVEGVGHYEPLRHYAEVHVLIEPLPRGSGVQFATACSTDDLAANWQNLILMHFGEKQHRGVLTGSPLTDVRLTLLAGRAHPKHTEGGDFRQATYRAVRQGLMKAESVLLEPYCRFRLEVPPEQIGRAISDVRRFHGSFDAPEERGALTLLRGRAPVRLFGGYAADLAAYTGGRGRLTVENDGYDVCADAAELIAEIGYEPERDLDNTPDSVFCAHGGGFAVKWDKVAEYMHLAAWDDKANAPQEVRPLRRNFRLDDKELEAIMEREFGADKHPFYRYTHTVPREEKRPDRTADGHVPRKVVLVDGYNVVYAWDVLKDLAAYNLDDARTRLLNVLCSYAAYTDSEVICVFDAYRVPGGAGRAYTYNDIGVVFTKERESADAYIEKLVNEIGKNENVTVVT